MQMPIPADNYFKIQKEKEFKWLHLKKKIFQTKIPKKDLPYKPLSKTINLEDLFSINLNNLSLSKQN